MRPLVWTSWVAAFAAAVPFLWMLSIELGTSRRASRKPDPGDLELETRTGKLVDLGAGVAMVGGLISSLWLPTTVVEPRLLAFIIGVAFMTGALILSGSARKHLGRFHRDDLTRHPDHELVDTGPYRLVRHPLYTATSCAFLGIGFCLGTWISIGLAALPIGALIHRIQIEEQLLDRALGSQYRSYANRTARLIPRIW